MQLGEWPRARPLIESALERARRLGIADHRAAVHRLARDRSSATRAMCGRRSSSCSQSADAAARHGFDWWHASMLGFAAELAHELGEEAEADRHARDGLALAHRIGDRNGTSSELAELPAGRRARTRRARGTALGARSSARRRARRCPIRDRGSRRSRADRPGGRRGLRPRLCGGGVGSRSTSAVEEALRDGVSCRPAPSRSCSRTSRARRGCCTSSAPRLRGGARGAPARPARGVRAARRRRGGHAGRRVLRRLRARVGRARGGAQTARRRSTAGRSASGWGCTPASRS